MAVEFGNQVLFVDDMSSTNSLLQIIGGDILCYSMYYMAVDNRPLSLQEVVSVLQKQWSTPTIRLSVLNKDETVNYSIPNDDIVQDGVTYHENYVNGQRRDLSFKLINVREYDGSYKYYPNVNGLWYGTKIKYEQGLSYMGKEYYFPKGVYIINNFDLQHSLSARDITYQCTDKFGLFEGSTGVLDDGYEIPVDTPIEDVIDDLMNLSCSDGYVNDLKVCIIDSKYMGFKTHATIRVDAGSTIKDIIDQLATQMSAEYYYNTIGNLILYPMDESMNDVNKPIIWTYDEDQLEGLQFVGDQDIVNVVKVVGNNVDGKIYTAIVKNTNLNSPINIYHIKERKMAPIDTANVLSDESAEELAKFHLRKKSILNMKQQCNVPYNPLIMVNSIVEIENKDLNMEREKYMVNSVSYTSGSATMQIDIANITNLPTVGGINYNGQ